MSNISLLNPPTSLKPVSHYLKVAIEHDTRDKVIAYWARFAAVQKSLVIDKSSPEAKIFVIKLLEWLETQKKELAGNESITIEAAGEAHIENYALKLFSWADQSDRSGTFNKNVVKAFYTAGILFDILESLRPPLSEEFSNARKYSKWKAAYIHNCLKNGETPTPGDGTMGGEDEDDEQGAVGGNTAPTSSYGFVNPSTTQGDAANTNEFGMGGGAPYGGGGGVPYGGSGGVPYGGSGGAPYGGSGGAPYGGSGGAPPNVPYDNPYQQPPQQPYVPPTPQPPTPSTNDVGHESATGLSLSVEQIAKAQKYCKWAGSALNFDDVNSAVENLEKALHLLKTGKEL